MRVAQRVDPDWSAIQSDVGTGDLIGEGICPGEVGAVPFGLMLRDFSTARPVERHGAGKDRWHLAWSERMRSWQGATVDVIQLESSRHGSRSRGIAAADDKTQREQKKFPTS